MSVLRRAVRGSGLETRAREWGDSSIPPPGAAMAISAGGQVLTEAGLLGVITALACVSVLANDVSMLPFDGYTRRADGSPQKAKKQPILLTEPFGPDLAPEQGVGQLVTSMAMRGNAYATVVSRDDLEYPTQLAIQHPDFVQVYRDRASGRKACKVNGKPVPIQDLVHIPTVMLPGALIGIDPITYAAQGLGQVMDAQTFTGNFWRNGAAPSGVIQTKDTVDRKKAREIKTAWEAGNAGLRNAHRTAILGGGAEWKPISVTPEQAQFLETRKFLREEVCGLFGVPLGRVMAIVERASQGGGKGLEQQDTGYVVHTLVPYLTRIEKTWTRMLPGADRTFARFFVDGMLRATALERWQIYQIGRTIGALNKDEIREREDMPPIPGGGGQDYNAPLNSNIAEPPADDNGPDGDHPNDKGAAA